MAIEKRLIDANVAMLNTYNEVYWTESEAAAVRSFLVQQKTVDAVEVVRCKDCKWYNPNGGVAGQPNIICSYKPKDFFCSYGERRNDVQRNEN